MLTDNATAFWLEPVPVRKAHPGKVICGQDVGFVVPCSIDKQLGLFPILGPFLFAFQKTFREMGVISTHIPLETHFRRQTKIPEKPGVKPLFGDFTLELLIRFERTTCSLRVSCSTG